MSILKYDNITSGNIGSTATQNGLGFCYLDPVTETLKEFSSDATVIPVNAYEEAVRRYYVVKDDNSLTGGIVNITITSTSSDYEVKNLTLQVVDENAFSTTPDGNTNIVFLADHPSGIIPVDVYIKSLTYSFEPISFNIVLEII